MAKMFSHRIFLNCVDESILVLENLRDNGRIKQTNNTGFWRSPEKMYLIFSGIFPLLLEGIPGIDNRDKSCSERRDQDEPDGKIRKYRTGTTDDAGNFE